MHYQELLLNIKMEHIIGISQSLTEILYMSRHAIESCLQPENCVPVKPWKAEADDTVLLDLIPFLECVSRDKPADIKPVLESYKGCDIPSEFIARSKDHQRPTEVETGAAWR